MKMLQVHTDGLNGFTKRALARARKIDAGKKIERSISITFDDPVAMVELLTAQRVRLIHQVRLRPASITELANTLQRDASAVRKDVTLLEKAGVILTEKRIHPGHGQIRFVTPVAQMVLLTTAI
jgi:predicted transcriptional regulator